MKTLKKLNVERIAKAIEADAGEPLHRLRESLADAKAGVFATLHTPAQVAARRRGRCVGSVQAVPRSQ